MYKDTNDAKCLADSLSDYKSALEAFPTTGSHTQSIDECRNRISKCRTPPIAFRASLFELGLNDVCTVTARQSGQIAHVGNSLVSASQASNSVAPDTHSLGVEVKLKSDQSRAHTPPPPADEIKSSRSNNTPHASADPEIKSGEFKTVGNVRTPGTALPYHPRSTASKVKYCFSFVSTQPYPHTRTPMSDKAHVLR
jgi:hypothetical protein